MGTELKKLRSHGTMGGRQLYLMAMDNQRQLR